MTTTTAQPLVTISGLTIDFSSDGDITRAVHGIGLELASGEVLGLVGESGSGKSVTSFALAGLLPTTARLTARRLDFDGENLLAMSRDDRRSRAGSSIAMIYQDATSALNPVLTIGQQLVMAIRLHSRCTKPEARRRAAALLALVEIPNPNDRLDDYPHQFSGGQRQRAMIALALCGEPRLLIADEPTTALDVTVQAQIVRLVVRLARERGMSVIWVTHDLALVAQVADRVAVMCDGRIVESGPTESIFASPLHPYTRRLLAAVPRLGDQRRRLSLTSERGWTHVEGDASEETPLGQNPTSVDAIADETHRVAPFRPRAAEGVS